MSFYHHQVQQATPFMAQKQNMNNGPNPWNWPSWNQTPQMQTNLPPQAFWWQQNRMHPAGMQMYGQVQQMYGNGQPLQHPMQVTPQNLGGYMHPYRVNIQQMTPFPDYQQRMLPFYVHNYTMGVMNGPGQIGECLNKPMTPFLAQQQMTQPMNLPEQQQVVHNNIAQGQTAMKMQQQYAYHPF